MDRIVLPAPLLAVAEAFAEKLCSSGSAQIPLDWQWLCVVTPFSELTLRRVVRQLGTMGAVDLVRGHSRGAPLVAARVVGSHWLWPLVAAQAGGAR